MPPALRSFRLELIMMGNNKHVIYLLFISIFVLRIMAYFSKTVTSHVLNTMTSFLSTVLKTLDPLMQFLWFWNFVGNFFKKIKKNNPFKITKSYILPLLQNRQQNNALMPTLQGGRNWGAEGAQAPHLFWIYIVKISKFLKFRKKFFFLFSRAPP